MVFGTDTQVIWRHRGRYFLVWDANRDFRPGEYEEIPGLPRIPRDQPRIIDVFSGLDDEMKEHLRMMPRELTGLRSGRE